MGTLDIPDGYIFIGVVPVASGYADTWQVTYSRYHTNEVYAYVKSYYPADISGTLECNALYMRT